ncbi:excalibur calcium-binding domain-containing protein [Rothia aeria]
MTTHHKFATIGAVATLSLSLVGATAVPAAFAAPATNTAAVAPAANASHTYDDGATITFPSSWIVGQGLSFTGTGFKAKDGSPSVLALKIDGGGVSGQPYLRVEADANGNVAGTIPWQEGFKPGQTVTLTVLTGSLNKQDPRRGGDAATVTIQAAAAPSASPTDTAAASAAPAPTEAAPSSSASAAQSATEAPAASSASAAVTGKPQPPVQPSAAPSQSEQAADNSAQDSSSAEHNVPNASANAEHLAAAAQGSAVAGEIPKNCTEASARGLSNIDANSPHYDEHLDRDKDGVGCETKATGTSGSGTASTTGGKQAAAADTSTNDELDNCTEARARGLNNIKAGSEHYSGHLDRDKDGVACESRVSGGSASRVSSTGTVASTGSTGSYSAASTTRGRLANTGASGALTIAGVGLFTLVAGTAVVLVARRRKQA